MFSNRLTFSIKQILQGLVIGLDRRNSTKKKKNRERIEAKKFWTALKSGARGLIGPGRVIIVLRAAQPFRNITPNDKHLW
jgi:hypothetical protein